MDIVDGRLAVGLVAGIGCGVAIGWMLSMRRSPSSARVLQEAFEGGFAAGHGDDYKMVLVVRNDLKMGKGKAAAQCCHAAVSCCKHVMRRNPKVLGLWENCGQPKVVVKVDNEEILLELAAHCQRVGLQSYLVHDAGRTQIAAGSRTVLGVGPGPVELVDEVTGHLKLF